MPASMPSSGNRRRFLDAAGLVAGASVLDAVRPTRAAQAAMSSLAWNVQGGKVYACPCEVTCPCDFGSAPSHGSCTVIEGFRIDSGRYGDVNLDGLNAALMIHSPGHMAHGHFRIAFYLDDRANPAQREALSAIFTIKPGGAFARITKAVDQDLGARFVPITIESNKRQWKFSVSRIAGADITAIAGRNEGELVTISNLKGYPGPLVVGRSTHTTYKDYDVQLDVSGRIGTYSSFVYTSA
jgi:hypothetical protein